MRVRRTNDPIEALGWARDLDGAGSPAAFLLAPARFAYAERTDDSLALTLRDEGWVGVALGPDAPERPEWRRCLRSGASPARVGALEARDRWDFFARAIGEDEPGEELHDVSDAGVIERFLQLHAPHSAVWPGNPEIVAWLGLDDADGLASLAALVRWESGYHVVSSVATRADARGRGLATRIMSGVVHAASRRHLDWLGLGVGRDNDVAQRLYERVGFERRARFTVYDSRDSADSRH